MLLLREKEDGETAFKRKEDGDMLLRKKRR